MAEKKKVRGWVEMYIKFTHAGMFGRALLVSYSFH